MDMLIKIAAVCIPSALIAGVLRKDSPAMALLVALAAGCVVLFSALGALELNELLSRDFEAGLDRYLRVEAMDPEAYYYSEALEEAELSDIFDLDSYERAAAALAEALSE